MKKVLSLVMSVVFCLGAVGLPVFAETGETPVLRVDMAAEGHDILHGSAGFLYGISNEGVPDVNTLTPLKPKVLATKGALGTEHPYGDALDVAEEFFEAGGQQVQMYNSNYYGVFGVTADANDYGKVLRETIAPYVAEWKDEKRAKYPDIDSRLVYIPINEGTPVNVNGGRDYNAAWKIYYDAIKSADPTASIAGPNDASYRGHNNMYDFIRFCKDNNCLPDIFTWHELQVECLDSMDEHIADYRSISDELGVEWRQVVINEYADYSDCGVPGRLVNWIARLEDNQVYGCLPFWHQANNLNDLAAEANQGNGAWWVYKWYGEMSGRTLKVSSNTAYNRLYGVAAIDENKRSASVVLGGEDGDITVKLDNIADTNVFGGAEKVHIKVEATYFTGYHGAAFEPETVMEGVFPVVDGSVSLNLSDALFSTAYRVTVTEAADDAEVTEGRYHAEYEAENAVRHGSIFEDYQYTPLEYPSYYCSGGIRVGGLDSDGDGIEYAVDVPYDGRYRLGFIYGNGVGSTRNNQNTHAPRNITNKLIIDGAEEELLLPNTLFYSMEGCVERYVDLTAGRHRIALMYDGQAGAFHDALYVSYDGAIGQERPAFNKYYEAEAADFNIFGGVPATAENSIPGFSGSGYVTGLESSAVESGGGIRWVADIEESGLYHLNFRYKTEDSGNIRIYLDNTNRTFANKLAETPMTAGDWAETHITAYLRRGINIIDIDTDVPSAVDYMQILRCSENRSITVEAEDGEGSFDTAEGGGVTYVKEMKANDGWLEFTVDVPSGGLYRMQVFQSNNDLCGTHSYNIKIIDRYAVFEVNGERAGRYFFPNSFSDDTFLERTVPVELEAGENTVKVYNDDSWQVLWGGSTWEPGKERLENYTPNFDKFVFTPALVEAELPQPEYPIHISRSGEGWIYADKDAAKAGETVRLYLLPDGEVEQLTVNGEDITSRLSTDDFSFYTADITVTGETEIYARFSAAREGDYTEPQLPGDGSVAVNGKRYKIVGDNLFKNSDFSDNSGADMEQWYVGAHTDGHPQSGADMPPRINADGGLENLTPLAESNLLLTGGYEPGHGDNVFYFGEDNSRPEGLKHYLVEAVGGEPNPWERCAWNGACSLLAFVPIKPDKNYYFRFNAYTLSGAASVRYGAINMDEYIPESYSESGSLNFSGSGYMDCTNGGRQNVGGGWTVHDGVIESGDGNYFLFNAYWLQMAEFLCMGGFELYELSDEPLVRIDNIIAPAARSVKVGGEFTPAGTVEAVDENGLSLDLPVTWLNLENVDVTVPGVYAVTGYVTVPEGYYCDGGLYVRQRVVVTEPSYPAEIISLRSESGGLTVGIKAWESVEGTLYLKLTKNGAFECAKARGLKLAEGEIRELDFTGLDPACDGAALYFWDGGMRPLAAIRTQ